MSRRFRLRPLAFVVCLAFTAPVATLPAHADNAQTLRFELPAGPLSTALTRLAAQAGARLSVDATLVSGKTAPAVSGALRLETALDRILAGSGLVARLEGDAIVVRRAPLPKSPVTQSQAVEPAQMPLVVVHSSLPGDLLDERMSLSAAKIIVGREEIEAYGDASMGEVIRRMPSVSFGGPPGENNDARIRGLGKEYTRILIDGQPVPGRDFSIDQIPAHQVERIEIIRTPTANLDNQGIAGIVNIVLRKPPEQRSARWHAGVGVMPDAPGDGKAGQLGLSFGDRVGDLSYQWDGTLQNRFGVRTKDRQDFANGLATLTNRELDYEVREHQEGAMSGRLVWRLRDGEEIRIDPRYTYSNEIKERDRLKKATLADAERLDQEKLRQYLAVNTQWTRSAGHDQRDTLGLLVQGARTDTDKTERRGAAGTPFTALPGFISGNDDRIEERGVIFRAARQRRINTIHGLDFGFEAGRQDWTFDRLAWRQENRSDLVASRFRVEENKFALYAQDEILLGETHVFTPGIRFEHATTESFSADGTTGRATHLQTSPSLHWLSSLDTATNWRVSATRSIRRPKFEDLAAITDLNAGTLDDPDSVGNPALEPETAWALETSLERYFNERRGVASANLFYRWLDNLIERRIVQDATTGRFQNQFINVAEARTWGVEFDGSYRFEPAPAHALVARGNVSLLRSTLYDTALGRDRAINDQPRHILNVGVDYEYKPWKLKTGLNFNEAGDLTKFDAAGPNQRVQRQDPSRFLDAYLLVPLGKSFALRASIVNALEAEKNRPRVTTRPDGTTALFEQEDEASARAFFLRLEGRF